MDLSLKGMRALVCGSSQGIGKEIAIELANEGVEVLLTVSYTHLRCRRAD